jgi:hypothetical protein
MRIQPFEPAPVVTQFSGAASGLHWPEERTR